ncbi:hypothetical protein [Paenibacillus xylanexedens]|uniref:hypothetical protein n=1 Tax=Paenibacillus xylanexedens TaxID=528191 RepID=UPI0011AA386E|nr:hypothetical protein [Paenibacillus xylanexedens]
MKQYAVYKGEKLVAMGTSYQCAQQMGVTAKYIVWMTMPAVKKRLAKRKNPDKATTCDVLD